MSARGTPGQLEARPSGDERLGLLFAALCASNGAFVPAIAKLSTGRAAPLLVATATGLFAGACSLLLLAVRGELGELFRGDRWPRLVTLGALGTGLAFFLFFSGARRTTAIETVLVLQIEPAYALLFSWLVLGHRPTPRRLGALAAILAGIGLALGTRIVSVWTGIVLLLATPLCWQLSHLLVLRGIRGASPWVLTTARYAYGSLLLALAFALSGQHLPSGEKLLALLPLFALQGIGLSMLGTLLWYQTIARLDLGRATSIVVPSIPLLSLGASFLVLGDVATARQWVGLLLTAAGVLGFVTGPAAATRAAR